MSLNNIKTLTIEDLEKKVSGVYSPKSFFTFNKILFSPYVIYILKDGKIADGGSVLSSDKETITFYKNGSPQEWQDGPYLVRFLKKSKIIDGKIVNRSKMIFYRFIEISDTSGKPKKFAHNLNGPAEWDDCLRNQNSYFINGKKLLKKDWKSHPSKLKHDKKKLLQKWLFNL